MLAVDPGFGGTGFAVFRGRKLTRCGVLHPPRAETIVTRAHYLADAVATEVALSRSDTVLCEWPSFFDTAGGHLTARSGALGKLFFLVGTLHGRCATMGVTFRLVPVALWKGQLPKPVVIRRIRRVLGAERCKELHIHHDAWDAVGIGLHFLGDLTCPNPKFPSRPIP